MKRFFIVLLAFVFVDGFVAEAAAEDRLSLSGSMRVRAWDHENYADYDDNTDDTTAYFDQRFRLGATIKATEFVSAHLRLDFGEDNWGSTTWSGSRPGYGTGTDLQVDRAYMQIKQDLWTLQAGQLFQYTGMSYIVLDGNNQGINFTLNLPVTVKLMYSKYSENGSNNDSGAFEDKDLYAVDVRYAQEAFTVGGFYALLKDSTSTDNSPNSFGVYGKFALGPVNLKGEVDIMGGDQSTTVEYVGTQIFLDGNMNFGTTMVGVNFMYAAAQSTDGTEVQYTAIDNWNGWRPHSYIFGSFVGTDMSPTGNGQSEVMDFTTDGAGVVGASVYAKFVPMDALALYAQLVYLTPEDDTVAKGSSDYDTATIINLSGVYTIVPNATIGLAYSTTMVDMQTAGTKDDSAQRIMSRLQITF